MGEETMVAVIGTQAKEPAGQESQLSQAVTNIQFQAESVTIDSSEDYQKAAEIGRLIKQRSSEVKSFFKPLKDAAHKAHKQICDRESQMLKPLESAEKILKQTMGAYVAEQERKRREAEEKARRAAEEEAERRMSEAIELEKKGNTIAAEAAFEEAEIMDEAKQSVFVPEESVKAAGVVTKKDWVITGIDTSNVPVFFDGIEIRPVDKSAIMRIIRASKGQVRIPGILYSEKTQVSFRK